jgi:hypothetical protein
MIRRPSFPLLIALTLAGLLAMGLASPAQASSPAAASVGPGHGVGLPSADDGHQRGVLFMNYDGSAENGYCWCDGGIAPPYYGAFAECYEEDYAFVTGIRLVLTGLGEPVGPLDAYVWADDNGSPGAVLSVTTGLLPSSVPNWPEVGTNDLYIIPASASGRFWVGYWADFSSTPCGYYVAADLDGPGGCPTTNISPGIGYPTGWNDVSVVWGPTRALGIGALCWDAHAGACCLPDLTCRTTYTPFQCAELSGEWMGYDVPCHPTPCGQSPGACCYPDGSCVSTSLANCPGGAWQPDAPCETADCGQSSLGACCVGSDCILVTEEGCPGRWLGTGESCEENPCPPAPPDSANCVDYGAYLRSMGSIGLEYGDTDVAVAGDVAYVLISGIGLVVIDIANPWVPRVLSSMPLSDDGTPVALAVSDGYAYVTTYEIEWMWGGLLVIDVRDPRDPRVVAGVSCGGCAAGVTVEDERAYVTTRWADDGHGSLVVFDVSDPQSPQLLGAVDTPSWLRDVAVEGAYAYVVGGGLQVIDVSDPLQPRIVGSVGGGGQTVAVEGTRAYVVGGGLRVIDVTDPQSPWVMGSAPLPYVDVAGVAVSGSHAFVSGSGLRVVDVSDPSQPEVVGGLDGGEGCVAVAGERAYLAESGRFRVVDISNPVSPPALGAAATPDLARGVAISGTHAYVPAWNAGLQVIDISDAENPLLVGSVATPGPANAVAVSGHRAYVGWWGGLEVIDIADPRNPRSVGGVSGFERVLGVSVLAGHAYVVDYGGLGEGGHLHVIDVAQASRPVVVGGVAMDGGPMALTLSESGATLYAYVAVDDDDFNTRYSLLQVVDVTDPESPQVVATSQMPQSRFPRGVAIAGNHAYLTGGGFDVIDITDPRNPRFVASAQTPDFAHAPNWTHAVALSGPYAYTAGSSFFAVFDISVPQHPWFVGGTQHGEGGFGDYPGNNIAVGDSVVYVADSGGLRILPTQCRAQDPSGLTGSGVPAAGLRLSAFPEPASRATTIRLTLPAPDRVRVTLHDVTGRLVRCLYDGSLGAGLHRLSWDGTDGAGRAVPAGIYLARASTSDGVTTARVVILR